MSDCRAPGPPMWAVCSKSPGHQGEHLCEGFTWTDADYPQPGTVTVNADDLQALLYPGTVGEPGRRYKAHRDAVDRLAAALTEARQ